MPDEKKAKAPSKPTKLPVTKGMCDGIVGLLNAGYQMSPWRDDALDETEQKALGIALYKNAKTNVYIGNIIYRVMTVSGEAELLAVVGAIVVTRLAKRSIVPDVMAFPASMYLAKVAGEEIEVPSNVDAGGARRADRQDGDGQDNAFGGVGEQAPLRPDVADKIGYLSLAEVPDDQPSVANGYGTGNGRRKRETYSPLRARRETGPVPSGDQEGV